MVKLSVTVRGDGVLRTYSIHSVTGTLAHCVAVICRAIELGCAMLDAVYSESEADGGMDA